MPYSDIVNIVISSTSVGVTQKSFGIPCVIGYHTHWMDDYRVYSLGTISADLIADGFSTSDPVYKACLALGRNTPKTKTVIVGRLRTPFEQEFDITVLADAVEEDRILSFNVMSPAGVLTEISYTVQAGDTTTLIAVAVAALIDAVTDITAISSLGVISCAADNPGEMWYLDGLDIDMFGFLETTPDSNLVSEEAVIFSRYSDTYGLILADPNSNARVTVLAGATEAQERIFAYTTHDTEVGNGAGTADVFYGMKAALYFRTFGIYSGDQDAYAAAAWMGAVFPYPPGSTVWSYQQLSGVTSDLLSASFRASVAGKNGNYYEPELGTVDGKVAGGEWIDVIRGIDWNTARMKERLAGMITSASRAGRKVPYTQKGAESLGKEVAAQLGAGVAATLFSPDPEPIVFVPDVNDPVQVSTANKASRTLPGLRFEATLAGAIIIVDPLNGIISI